MPVAAAGGQLWTALRRGAPLPVLPSERGGGSLARRIPPLCARSAIGVEVNKIHRQRQIVKRIHVRVEHVRPSRAMLGHLERIKANEALKKAAKESGKPCPAEALRRQPKGARDGFTLNMGAVFDKKVHLLKPEPYVFRPLEKAYLK